jgi:hypothetical protein
MANKSTRKVITPVGTLSFPALAEPNKKGKYSCAIVFAPGTDLSELDALIEEAKQTIVPAGVNVKGIKIPLQRDGSEKEEYGGPYVEGARFFECSTNFPPGIVDSKRAEILNVKEELYPGAQVRLQVHLFYFDNDSKGLAFGLDNVQKAGDGERLGGEIPKAEDVFDEIDTSDLTG